MTKEEELKKWLNSRGGRTLRDIREDHEGIYVFMDDAQGKKEKVFYKSNPKQ